MSSDYFFRKWKHVLRRLEVLVNIDREFQTNKHHEKRRCDTMQQLAGVLGSYISIYNDALDCLRMNLQLQKTEYIEGVVKSVVARILELKHQLRKLDCSQHIFLSQGLVAFHLTTQDAEINDIPFKKKRSRHIDDMVEEAITNAKEKLKKQAEDEKSNQDVEPEPIDNWWDDEVECNKEETGKNHFTDAYQIEEVVTEEMIEKKAMIVLIQAQERNRQVTRWMLSNKQKREIWTKELTGTLQPQPRRELKEKSARLLQKVFREYIKLKRKKIQDCKRDELLGISMCGVPRCDEQKKAEEIQLHREEVLKKLKINWEISHKNIKENYMNRKAAEISEDFRDKIRDWMQNWYEQITFFHNIPSEDQGGAALIFKEEIPDPIEWFQQYQAFLEKKKRNKNKSAQQLKFEKMESKREEMRLKKEELMKKKLEADLMKKIMKNPTLHPGYEYPESKKIYNIISAMKDYYTMWGELDNSEIIEVKEKTVEDIDIQNQYAEAKIEILKSVEDDMRAELKLLKTALKNDYKNKDEKMPEEMKEKKRRKKKVQIKTTVSELIKEKMEELAMRGVLKEYPHTNLNDFVGDHNFAGNDLRCFYVSPIACSGEVRSVWWDRCRELTHGSRRILILGPPASGKTTLVHAMASVNNAVLFELDPTTLDTELLSCVYLQHIVDCAATCARAAQPALIHIRRIQQLFCKKSKNNENNSDIELIKRYFIRHLFKKINKSDNITIIGTCIEPWVTKAGKMLKQFPEVVLVPDTSYSLVVQLLNTWVTSNHFIPRNFDVHSLARVLRGYEYGFLQKCLQHFELPDQIVKIAVHGLTPEEVLNFVLENDHELHRTNYEKYEKWYLSNTFWGKKEKKDREEQLNFKLLSEKYAEKIKKKKASAAQSSASLK